MKMKMHKRTAIVVKAEEGIIKELHKHDLTFGETIRILSGIMSTGAKYKIREERHPENPDKGGDEE